MLIVTTVPDTLLYILRDQPKFLSEFFELSLATNSDPRIEELCHHENVMVYPIPIIRNISPVADVVSIIRMIQLIVKLKPTLIHSYTPKAGLVSMISAFLTRVPIRVHTFTGLVFPTAQEPTRTLLKWVDRLICFCATDIVPEGLGVKSDLERFSITHRSSDPIGHGNIAGIDIDYFSVDATGMTAAAQSLLESLDLPENTFIFSFIGRLNKDKGVSELVNAFSNLPIEAHLVIAGDLDLSAPLDSATSELIESHARIHALGFVDDVRPLLAISDILVLSSYREGFPNVLLQAGAMRRPAIASDINGCNEIIENGKNGWLVPAKDVDGLQQAMQTAMNEEAQTLHNMGKNAREKVVGQFERQAHWSRMLAFYRALIQKKQHK